MDIIEQDYFGLTYEDDSGKQVQFVFITIMLTAFDFDCFIPEVA